MDAPATTPRPPRILIAEDTPSAAELLGEYLDGTGYEIYFAGDGEQTLQQVEKWQPDLVLLDVMMPRLSGFEVCKRLKANPRTRDITVLMITALDQPSDIERAVEAGTNEFMSKPIKRADLLHRVRSLLHARQQGSEMERTLAYFEAVEKPDER